MKYPPAPLTPFFTSLPLTRPHRFLRHARPSRTAQVLSAAASIACALLNSLASLFAAAVLYFQSLAHSFAKHPGYGVSRSDWWTLGGSRRRLPMPETVLRDTQGGVRLPLLQFGSPQRAKSFASYHIPATLAFSCDYALFPATAARQTPSPQALTHSFHHNRGGTPALLRIQTRRFFRWPTMLSSITIPCAPIATPRTPA